ncbi:MAG: hypothetical protein KJ623_00345 [Nanoarchaeota archaeon]|nr:hypothetical protein [Nanoarchaeota archaeon]MBU0962430.1 hypothetical protein [Nanoarchaeota archaeon]
MGLKQKLGKSLGVIGLVGLLAGGCSDLNKYFEKEEPKKEIYSSYKHAEPKKEIYCYPNLIERINKLADLEDFIPSNGKYEEINVDGKTVKINYQYCNPGGCYDSTEIEGKISNEFNSADISLKSITYSFKENGSTITIKLDPTLKEKCDGLISIDVNGELIKDPEIRKKAFELNNKILNTIIQLKEKYDVPQRNIEIKKAEDTARKAFGA